MCLFGVVDICYSELLIKNFKTCVGRMTEVGESSRVREEEFRDIHVVWEEPPVAVEPVVAEEPIPPVIAEDGEDEPELDPSEDPVTEDDEPAEYADDMGTTANDIIEALQERNMELEAKVQTLESQAVTHQSDAVQMESVVLLLATRSADNGTKLTQAEHTIEELKAENRALQEDLAYESAERSRAENAWARAARRVDLVEQEVRAKKARIDTISYACWSAFGRAQNRIVHYPVQYDQSRHTISRGLVAGIIDEEYQDSVRRGLLP